MFSHLLSTISVIQGVLSVYNSALHSKLRALDAELVLKSSVGGAATVRDGNLLPELLREFKTDLVRDWQMCRQLIVCEIEIAVARNSRAQHLGIGGTNNRWFGNLDYGIGFDIDGQLQALARAKSYQSIMPAQLQYVKQPKLKFSARLIRSIKKCLRRPKV